MKIIIVAVDTKNNIPYYAKIDTSIDPIIPTQDQLAINNNILLARNLQQATTLTDPLLTDLLILDIINQIKIKFKDFIVAPCVLES